MFKKSNQESRDQEYLVAYDIAKGENPCLEGELVKDCILKKAKFCALINYQHSEM